MRIFVLAAIVGSGLAAETRAVACDKHLRQKPRFIESGREGEEASRFQKAVTALFAPGGPVEKLGIELPPQYIKVLAGREMDTMGALGRHPVRHWHDGAEVLKNLGRYQGLLYEFVPPQAGCQGSYFRDTTPFAEKMSIIFHVIGHQWFSLHSRYKNMRDVDVIGESLYVHDLLESAYRHHDHDEVSLWYQKLLTLVGQQDLARGTHDDPEVLRGRKPKAPTASLLQAFVASPPAGLPEWKVDLARSVERLHRHYSGGISTKIMNEGFATLMQELIAEHTDHNTFQDALSVGNLLSGVLHGGLGNPYALGLTAWRRIRERFNQRPENQGLTPIERDRRFLEYAKEPAKMDQYQLLLFALDRHWVVENQVFLSEKIPSPTRDIGMPSPDNPFPEARRVISRDPQRVIAEIVKQVADRSRDIPRIVRVDAEHGGSGFLLVSDGEMGESTPLERTAMVATLFEDAGLFAKTMTLKTVALSSWVREEPIVPWMDKPWWGTNPPGPTETVVPVEIEVRPDGSVDVRYEGRSNAKMAADLKARLDAYRAYQAMGFEGAQERERRAELGRASASVIAAAVEAAVKAVPGSLLIGSPTAPAAILEFQNLYERRIGEIFSQAVRGQGWISRGDVIRLQAMPIIPEFRFDRRAMELLSGQSSLQALSSAPQASRQALSGEVEIDSGDRPEGDEYWGRGKPPKGEGDGEGDGEPGDRENEGDPTLPGRDPRDPSVVEIPPELYGRLLGENLTLPNLRPKNGASPMKELRRGGKVTRAYGELLPDEIRAKAYGLGFAKIRRKEGPEAARDVKRCVKEGLKLLKRDDYVVRDWRKEKTPEVNAHVTFAIDLSGSMGSDLSTLAKVLSFDLRALIKNKYSRTEFSYVAFDGQGHVYKTLDDFLKAKLGGGTDYASGFEAVRRAQEEYPSGQWDRYVFVMGDLEDGGDFATGVAAAEVVRSQSQYFGAVWTKPSSFSFPGPIKDHFRTWSEQDPYVGFAEAEVGSTVTFPILKTLLKN